MKTCNFIQGDKLCSWKNVGSVYEGEYFGTSSVPPSIIEHVGLCSPKLLPDELLSEFWNILREAVWRNRISVLLSNTQKMQLRWLNLHIAIVDEVLRYFTPHANLLCNVLVLSRFSFQACLSNGWDTSNCISYFVQKYGVET